jgi:hypothetical protein
MTVTMNMTVTMSMTVGILIQRRLAQTKTTVLTLPQSIPSVRFITIAERIVPTKLTTSKETTTEL